MLWNRLLWLGIALATLAFTYLRFRFAHRTESDLVDVAATRRRRSRGRRRAPDAGYRACTAVADLRPAGRAQTFGFAIHAAPDARHRRGRRSGRSRRAGPGSSCWPPSRAARSWCCSIECSTGAFRCCPDRVRPHEYLTAPLTHPLNRWVIVPLLIVFFAGELVWRERDAGWARSPTRRRCRNGSSSSASSWASASCSSRCMALLTLAGMLAQVILGYHDFEIGLYLQILFGLQLPEYLLFALLALVVHVRGEPEVRRPPGGDHRLRLHRLRRHARDRAQPARLRRRPGVVLHGHARLRPVRSGRGCGSSSTGQRGRCCSRWWRGCSGCAGRESGLRQCGSSWRAVASRARRPRSPRRRWGSSSRWAASSSTTRTC